MPTSKECLSLSEVVWKRHRLILSDPVSRHESPLVSQPLPRNAIGQSPPCRHGIGWVVRPGIMSAWTFRAKVCPHKLGKAGRVFSRSFTRCSSEGLPSSWICNVSTRNAPLCFALSTSRFNVRVGGGCEPVEEMDISASQQQSTAPVLQFRSRHPRLFVTANTTRSTFLLFQFFL